MARSEVNSANLDTKIAKVLTQFADDIKGNVNEVGVRLAKVGAREINASASRTFQGHKYSRSWTVATEKARTGNSFIIHSTLPGLPHLLENGHASRNGGRVSGRPHIQPVEEELIKKYQEEVIDVIQGR